MNIQVIIMGETGCGKTRLIEFMSKLQVPTELKEELKTMVIVKVRTNYPSTSFVNRARLTQISKWYERSGKITGTLDGSYGFELNLIPLKYQIFYGHSLIIA